MPESETAGNLGKVEQEPEQEQPLEQEAISDMEKKLTKNELQSLLDKKTTIPKIIQQREQYKAAAKAELNRLVTVTTEGGKNLIDLKEYKQYNDEIEGTESAEKMADLLDEIKEIPRQKQNEEQNEKEEARELSPEDPELLTLQRKFDKICDQNKYLIGLKQVPGFKAWFAGERKSNPNIKHLKEQIKRLEGKEITDRNGLAPRREEFLNLQNLFKRHGINSPLKSDWVKSEGLSERIQFRKNAEEMEDIIRKLKGTGFYSKEIIKKTMQEILLADSPEKQKRIIQLAKNVARIEAQSFTHLDGKINIGGITIRKISRKGKDQLIDYYKTLSFSEREENVKKWPEFIRAEANLALELEELYGENKEALKQALGSFEELNFEEKQKALKEHKKLLEKSDNEEQLQKTLTIKAAHTKIDEATRNNILAKSTQRKYKEWFEDDNNFRDPKTKKPGSLEELKNAYSILISPTPDKEAKNLSAYQIKRMRFQKEVDELANINPNIKKSRLKKWQEKYDKEGWTKRKQVYKDLKKEQEKQKKEQEKIHDLENKADIEKSRDTNKEKKEENLDLKKSIESAQALMNEDKNAEALNALIDYWRTDPDNKEILFWMGVAKDRIEKFGSGKKLEESAEEQIKEEMENLTATDEKTKHDLTEQQIKTLNLQGQELSEQRHQGKSSAKERAKDESLSRVQDGSLEKDLTEDFYEQTDDSYILDEQKTGKKIDEIKFSQQEMTDEERVKLKSKTYYKQDKLRNREGMADVVSIDSAGKKMTSDEAKVSQKNELESLEKEMASKAEQRAANKTKRSNVHDLNAKIAARREAKRIIEEKRHKQL